MDYLGNPKSESTFQWDTQIRVCVRSSTETASSGDLAYPVICMKIFLILYEYYLFMHIVLLMILTGWVKFYCLIGSNSLTYYLITDLCTQNKSKYHIEPTNICSIKILFKTCFYN